MAEARLRSDLIVAACIRAAVAAARPAVVLRKGDPDSGAILVKTLARDGAATLYGQASAYDQAPEHAGDPAWRRLTGPGPAPETEIDARIAREASIDPDIWVVEVMDDDHDHPLNPRILKD